jgi:integrase
MLAAVPKVRPSDPEPWARLLSGLRLGEALRLSWDWQAGFSVDTTGNYPVFRIRSDSQKSGQDEVAPMSPDFGEWLLRTPEAERAGLVFPLPSLKAPGMAPHNVSRTVAEIGRKAGVVTDPATGACASAHDLRRSFGTRWAKRVMPAVLKRLMRHADISTTMGYYVDLDAGDVSAGLWADFGNKSGNIGPSGVGKELHKSLVDKHLGP